MKQWSRSQIINGLQEMIPEISFIKKSEDFDGTRGGIWTSSEYSWIFQGLSVFNFNLEYGKLPRSYIGGIISKHKEMKVKTMYVCGIHREIYSWLEERGWYPKWYDPGTLFFWKINDASFEIVGKICEKNDG